MIEELKSILSSKRNLPVLFRRNVAKDFFQIHALSFVYSSDCSRKLIFYGGSSLKHCHDLPRFSEDLDFVDPEGRTDLEALASGIAGHFARKSHCQVEFKLQKFRITVKLPLLKMLGLSSPGESDLLLLKLELFPDSGVLCNRPVEILPVFKHGQAILVKTFCLPTLMATKIKAVLHRKWEKKNDRGLNLSVKGRDYYDLMWYLTKKITPDFDSLRDEGSPHEIKTALLKLIDRVDTASIRLDIEALIEDQGFISGFAENIRLILRTQLEKAEWGSD